MKLKISYVWMEIDQDITRIWSDGRVGGTPLAEDGYPSKEEAVAALKEFIDPEGNGLGGKFTLVEVYSADLD